MNYAFHSEAETEFMHAIDYYERCSKGLGYDFAVEVYSTIEQIIAYPKAWMILEEEVRKCQTRRFPYGVLYTQELDGIFYTCSHASTQEPGLLEA